MNPILGVRRAAGGDGSPRLVAFLDYGAARLVREVAQLQRGAKAPGKTGKLEKIVQQVLARDKNCCQACGFTAPHFQCVVPQDCAAPDLRPSGLVTLCVFCADVFQLEQVAAQSAGLLIYLPELSQTALNHLARSLYLALADDGAPEMAALAARALARLKDRAGEAKRRLGTDDPGVLATTLLEKLSDADYAARAARLAGLRLLPLNKRMMRAGKGDVDLFPAMLNHWRTPPGPFTGKLPQDWAQALDLFQSSSSSGAASLV